MSAARRMRCMFQPRDCVVAHNGRKFFCAQVATGRCRFAIPVSRAEGEGM